MEREGQQVEHDKHAGQGFLTVAEVVFQMIALVFQDVEGLALDLPARAFLLSRAGTSFIQRER